MFLVCKFLGVFCSLEVFFFVVILFFTNLLLLSPFQSGFKHRVAIRSTPGICSVNKTQIGSLFITQLQDLISLRIRKRRG